MLARLLFDIGFGHWESRAVTGYFLLGAVPALAHPSWDRFGELVDAEPDERLRHRMARRLHGALAGRLAAPATGWLESPDPVLRSAGMQIVGSSGGRLPLDVVRRALADPDTVRAATYSIGMSGHPALRGHRCRRQPRPTRCGAPRRGGWSADRASRCEPHSSPVIASSGLAVRKRSM